MANGQIVNNTHNVIIPERVSKHVSFAKRTVEQTLSISETLATQTTIDVIAPVRASKHVSFAKRTIEPAVRAIDVTAATSTPTSKAVAPGITLVKKAKNVEEETFSAHMSLLGVSAL